MSGINTPAFCEIVKEFGCDVIFSGLISADGIARLNKKTLDLLPIIKNETPFILQIFGSKPDIMAGAAKILCENKNITGIDINMCCPVPKVNKNSAGAALMREPKLAANIVSAVVKNSCLPVSVKLRAGWNAAEVNAVEIAKICEDSGASAIIIHPRTREQKFSGIADWNLIAKVKENIKIPVIGSGDIKLPQDAKKMLDCTGCDSVMIGRAALSAPWILNSARHFLQTGEILSQPTEKEKLKLLLKHAKIHISYEGEQRGISEVRKFILWYTKGLKNASSLRANINQIKTYADLQSSLENIFA